MVLKTSELLPDPDTPVNAVSRRLGMSTLTSLRLLTRAPTTRMTSWRSATWVAGLISGGSLGVLDQTEDVAVEVGERGDEPSAADVLRRLLHRGSGLGHLGELALDVGDVPVGHRAGLRLRAAALDQPDLLAGALEADVVRRVGHRLDPQERGVHSFGGGEVGDGVQDGLDAQGRR